jgi:hypothetical protein
LTDAALDYLLVRRHNPWDTEDLRRRIGER